MVFYILSLLPLLLAPFLVQLLLASRPLARGLDAFVLVAVGGLVFFEILPHSIEEGGMPVLLALMVGLLLPFAIEKYWAGPAGTGHTLALIMALSGLALHGALDGVGLAAPGAQAEYGTELALAVLLHRVPAALAIWWMVRPRLGGKAGVLTLGVVAVATTFGFAGSMVVDGLFKSHWWYIVQALLVGTLVHVVTHQSIGPAQVEKGKGLHFASVIGGLAGLAALLGLSQGHQEHLEHLEHAREAGLTQWDTFLTLALRAAPALLAAYVLAGLLHAFSIRRVEEWLGRRSPLIQSAGGVLMGVPVNICSCAVGQHYQRMLKSGVPGPAALAFLVAAPEVGIAAVILSLRFLGIEVGLARLAFALVLGLVVGLVVGRTAIRHIDRPLPAVPCCPESGKDQGFLHGFAVTADHTLPWLLAGMGLAAILAPMAAHLHIDSIPLALQVPLFALAGLPLYVCATGSTPLVAVLLHEGVSPGAGIAFLLAGGVSSSSTLRTLTAMHSRKVAALVAALAFVVAVAAGFLVDSYLAGEKLVPLHDWHDQPAGWFEIASLGLLAAVVLGSLLRMGVPGFISRVVSLHGHSHDALDKNGRAQQHHDHGHDGPHEHCH